ncbi:Hypothetical protein FKW44_016569 [Caligus rogercresseyi]|uniref:Uncharacterized protein n=1 Tax=Caligus rogercresseyi TaxID=217165 RepID=A0A7T8H1Y1_CALRO|nr:Hypothetical protein FKW44_016569 [Caligus rogercresseyi]
MGIGVLEAELAEVLLVPPEEEEFPLMFAKRERVRDKGIIRRQRTQGGKAPMKQPPQIRHDNKTHKTTSQSKHNNILIILTIMNRDPFTNKEYHKLHMESHTQKHTRRSQESRRNSNNDYPRAPQSSNYKRRLRIRLQKKDFQAGLK